MRTTDAGEAALLLGAGARLTRHGHDLVLDLASLGRGPDRAQPALPAELRLTGIAAARPGLASASLLAYAPGHPDAPGSLAESERRWQELLDGEAVGPVLEPPSAAIVEGPGGTVVGAVVVTRLGPEAWGWDGGPWVADIFVVPSHQGRGLGRALIMRAVAWSRAAGERRIGLTVSDGNPAERLYVSAGFQRRRTLFVLQTETAPPSPSEGEGRGGGAPLP